MRYHSTGDPTRLVSLGEAVLNSLPPDRGLYVPETLPKLPASFWSRRGDLSFPELAFEIARPFLESDLDPDAIRSVVEGAITFDAPLVPVAEGIAVLELFHGPTLAFKDFGARFMARLMAKLRAKADDELTVLVATSGDTGAAVAAGFFGVEGVRVFVLFPKGRVSDVQEQQLTTFGGNITAVEVEGTFDDCQALVKRAFLDPELARRCTLTSANSINIARLIPQAFYYARAWQQRAARGHSPAFCVPSGNLGNLTAGLLARAMGLPVDRFVAATNANDGFVRYLARRPLSDGPATRTLSNAMDVAIPSNLVRIEALFGRDLAALGDVVRGWAFDDDATLDTMARVHRDFGYVLDPHTAVGWRAAEALRSSEPDRDVVVLATAHPAKFPEAVAHAVGHAPEPPPQLAHALAQPKKSVAMPADLDALRALL
jgi:threonine synthase